jgi:hypothetical protein
MSVEARTVGHIGGSAMAANYTKYMDRRTYAWVMVLLIFGPMGLTSIPGLEKISTSLSTAVLVCTAMFTGARLADAGYRRWVGVVGVVLTTFVFPLIGALAAAIVLNWPSKEVVISIALVCLLPFFGFVIWAGTRPSAGDRDKAFNEAVAAVFDDDPPPRTSEPPHGVVQPSPSLQPSAMPRPLADPHAPRTFGKRGMKV